MISKGPGFAVIYRWRLHPDKVDSFVAAWTRVSEFLKERGSLGSRLHRGSDGIWYSYAQWPSNAVRMAAFDKPSDDPAASAAMADAVAESLPDIELDSVADLLEPV